LTVDGSVTANAGTNLNTSLLALEAGGNLAAVRTALEIIDNFISGNRGLVTEDNSAAILAALTVGPVPISGSIAANSSADVLDIDGDAGYTDGELAKNLTQTPDGRLRTTAAAKVSDSRESYSPEDVRTLSMTTDGRLRVSVSEAAIYVEMFRNNTLFFSVPSLSQDGDWLDMSNNPWGL
jgi:hypothetical protein